MKVRRISDKEMIANRNSLDKMNGVRLKHPDKNFDAKNIIDRVIVTEIEPSLTFSLLALNGIKVKKDAKVVYGDDGVIEIDTETDRSVINWDLAIPQRCRGFEIRWLASVLNTLLTDHKLKGLAYKTPNNTLLHENEYAYINMVSLVNDINLYKDAILNKKKRKNRRIRLILELSAYKNSRLIIKGMNELISLIPDGDTDIAISTLIRVAYMITTGKKNFPKKFSDIDYINSKSNLEIVKLLGKSLSDNNKFLLPFNSYIDSSPRITIASSLSNNEYFCKGAFALKYLSFMMDDKYIEKFINRMIV